MVALESILRRVSLYHYQYNIHHFYDLRQLQQNLLVVGVVGVKDSGKSTLLRKAFDIKLEGENKLGTQFLPMCTLGTLASSSRTIQALMMGFVWPANK